MEVGEAGTGVEYTDRNHVDHTCSTACSDHDVC